MGFQGKIPTNFVLISFPGDTRDVAETSLSISQRRNKSAEFAIIKENIRENFSTKNWDNEGALPINLETLNVAEQFVEALEWNIPIPDIFPYSNGKIGMSWNDKTRALNLTVSETKKVVFNCLSKKGETFGTMDFSDFIVEDELKALISLFKI